MPHCKSCSNSDDRDRVFCFGGIYMYTCNRCGRKVITKSDPRSDYRCPACRNGRKPRELPAAWTCSSCGGTFSRAVPIMTSHGHYKCRSCQNGRRRAGQPQIRGRIKRHQRAAFKRRIKALIMRMRKRREQSDGKTD